MDEAAVTTKKKAEGVWVTSANSSYECFVARLRRQIGTRGLSPLDFFRSFLGRDKGTEASCDGGTQSSSPSFQR